MTKYGRELGTAVRDDTEHHLEAVVVETQEEHRGARLGDMQDHKVCGKTLKSECASLLGSHRMYGSKLSSEARSHQ